MNHRLTNKILMNLPFGYALHQFVVDHEGKPCDYIFLEVNAVFESQMGLSSEEIIGKKVTELLPDVVKDDFDWIKTYASVAYEDKTLEFEEYSDALGRWYKVSCYSPEKGYFVTLGTDITAEKQTEKRISEKEQLLKQQEILLDIYYAEVSNQEEFLNYILHKVLEMTGSEYANICLYDEEKQEFSFSACSDTILGEYKIAELPTRYQIDKIDIWGEVVRQKKPIILNDLFNTDQTSEDYPQGHIEFDHFISIPIIVDDKIVAVVDLGNNTTDYTNIVANQILLFMQSAWLIQNKNRLEERMLADRKKYGTIVNQVPALICEFKADSTLTFVNEAYCAYFGKPSEELIGKRFLEFIPIEDREEVKQRYLNLTAENPSVSYSHRVEKENKISWMEWQDTCVADSQGIVTKYYSIGSDITKKKQIEDEKDKQLMQMDAMFNGSGAVILVLDPLSGEIIEANHAATEFYGYEKEEFLHLNIEEISIYTDETVKELLLKILNQKQKYLTCPHQLKNGEIRIVDVYSSPIVYDNKDVLCSIVFDVTDREEAMKEIKYLAFFDFLTDAYNRRFFEAEYKKKNRKNSFPIAIIMGDVNGLKMINDTLGHSAGDQLLQEVAKRIKGCVRKEDILARIGGDEFAVLLTQTSEEEVKDLMKRLETLNQSHVTYYGKERVPISLSISFGYGIQKNNGDTLDDLMSEAETFMYSRKYYNSRSMKSSAIKAIVNTLFEKSEREELHSERVGLICEAIARELRWDDAVINRICVAGLLHDIGKIGINENILNKNGKLDDIEWEKMKLHPAKSARILESTLEYKDIAEVVLCHHERYDGTGYPKGLKENEIPLESRVIAVADAYDAMTENRPYRKAMTKEEAMKELKRCSGTQFDPEIVAVFMNIVLSKHSFFLSEPCYSRGNTILKNVEMN